MKHFNVKGMTCSACSTRVEKAVSSIEGVKECSVNLLTNSMAVDTELPDEEIMAAVSKAGYEASKKGSKSKEKKDNENDNISSIKKRLISSSVFLLGLMYFSMGYNMFLFPVPGFFDGNYIGLSLLQLVLSGIVLIINQKFFINGVKSLINKSPSMDTLVALGSGISYIYSLITVFMMSQSQLQNDIGATAHYFHNLYFESAAMILVLISVGKLLEEISKGKTTSAINNLMKMSPKNTVVLRGEKKVSIPTEEVKVSDIFFVKPGEQISVDGIIIEGSTTVDESVLTGESIPIDKNAGSNISAGTMNQTGYIKCKAKKVGEDTTLSQIIKIVQEATSAKPPIARVADKISGIFVPAIIAIAAVTFGIWMFISSDIGYALERGISVLVISCPCALGLATPVAIMVGNGVAAKNGILFKTAQSLENTGKCKYVILDKTGTITSGKPKVTDIIPKGRYSKEDLLQTALSLESKSEHPLAVAIINEAEKSGLQPKEVRGFKALSGNGVRAEFDKRVLLGGSIKFISKNIEVDSDLMKEANRLSTEGKTPMLFSEDENIVGLIAVADTVKSDSKDGIEELRKMNINTVMLTGDNENTARYIGSQIGIDNIKAEVSPIDKERVVREYKEKDRTIMVGDGINDAPALTSADIGIALGAGTDVAIDSADIVLTKNNLRDVPAAIRISKATLRNIHQNLFWAFFYNVLAIPIAAGVFVAFGLTLNPMIGALAMSLSSFCVVMNALRLNLYNPFKTGNKTDNKDNNKIIKTGEEKMKKIIKIEGMMCPHCEANVKRNLENINGVEEVKVSHKTGSAEITSKDKLENTLVKETIENIGYKVTDIKEV